MIGFELRIRTEISWIACEYITGDEDFEGHKAANVHEVRKVLACDPAAYGTWGYSDNATVLKTYADGRTKYCCLCHIVEFLDDYLVTSDDTLKLYCSNQCVERLFNSRSAAIADGARMRQYTSTMRSGLENFIEVDNFLRRLEAYGDPLLDKIREYSSQFDDLDDVQDEKAKNIMSIFC